MAIDLGDAHSPVSPIHPRRKQEVGRRLALAARAVQYGEQIVSTGPVFESLATSSIDLTATVSFTAGTAGGLHRAATADCSQVSQLLHYSDRLTFALTVVRRFACTLVHRTHCTHCINTSTGWPAALLW